jgi:hypothetical protein
MGRLEKLAAEGHLGPFEHVAWYDTDAPGLAVGPYVLPSACDGDDLADEMLLNGWRSARHLGLDVVRQLLLEGR